MTYMTWHKGSHFVGHGRCYHCEGWQLTEVVAGVWVTKECCAGCVPPGALGPCCSSSQHRPVSWSTQMEDVRKNWQSLLVQFLYFIALKSPPPSFPLDPISYIPDEDWASQSDCQIRFVVSNPASSVQFAFLSATSHQSFEANKHEPVSQCQKCHIVTTIIFILSRQSTSRDSELRT